MIEPDDYPGRREFEDREERKGMLWAVLICIGFWGSLLLWLLCR